jgi:hypothetical protein
MANGTPDSVSGSIGYLIEFKEFMPTTSRIRIGTMFNIIAQWHPLRLAEDFATLHNLSGGRDPRVGRTGRARSSRCWQPGVDRVVRQPRHGRGRSHQSRDH